MASLLTCLCIVGDADRSAWVALPGSAGWTRVGKPITIGGVESSDPSLLSGARYLRLTTFRRDGTAVATPVWVVVDDRGRLLVWTGSATGKAKRLRRDPQVRVCRSDARGNPAGTEVGGTARFLPVTEGPLVQRLLRQKYGWQKRALDSYNWVARVARRRAAAEPAYLELILGPG